MLLVIDNYDSFVFNLVHYFEELGAPATVIRNDDKSVDEILGMGADAIVISPGPCTPKDAGVCVDLIRALPETLPLLGVCLGHQAIAEAFGASVGPAKEIRHGKTSPVMHDATGVFAGLPSPFQATRYHSLAVAEDTLPAELIANARTADGEIMGLRHASRPVHGVQFHPESIASEHGHDLLGNFLRIAGLVREAA
jgi:anthranilate synthase component 2